MRQWLKNNYPLLIICLMPLVFFHQFFLYGKVYMPGEVLKLYFPWRSHLVSDDINSTYENTRISTRAISDALTIYYPHDNLYGEMLKKRKLALWNPYNFCGHPLFAEGRTAMLHPLKMVLFAFLSTGRAYTLLLIINHILLGLGMFLFLRVLKISKSAALFGALIWMFNGYMTINLEYNTHLQVGVFFAFTLFAIEKFLHEPGRARHFLLMALLWGGTYLSGHLQYVFYGVLLFNLYYLFRLAGLYDIRAEFSKIGRLILLLILANLLAMMIGAGQLIPSLELFMHSSRPELANQAHQFLAPLNLAGLVFPCASGDNEGNFFFSPESSGCHNNREANMYVGIIVISLILLAFLLPGHRREKLFFGLLVAVPFLIILKIPPFNLVLSLPIFSSSNPFRLLLFFHFGASVTAAIGLNSLLNQEEERSIKPFIIAMSILFCAALLTLSYFFSYLSAGENMVRIMTDYMRIHSVLKEEVGFTVARMISTYSLENPFFSIPLITWLLSLVGFALYDRARNNRRTIILLVLACLAIGELFFYGVSLQVTTEEKRLFFKTGFTDYLQRHCRDSRVSSFGINDGNVLPHPNTLLPYSILDTTGYASLFPGNYYRLMESMKNRYLVYLAPMIAEPGNYSTGIEEMLAIRYYYNLQGKPFTLNERFPGRYRYRGAEERLELYERVDARPVVFSVPGYRVMKDEKEILSLLFSDRFRPYDQVIVESAVPGFAEKETGDPRNDLVRIVKYEPGEVEVEIVPGDDRPFMLVISDNYYPGWKAKVNGKPVPLYRADYLFKGVAVTSASAHTPLKVTLEFFPDLYKLCFAISLAALLGIAAGLIFLVKS